MANCKELVFAYRSFLETEQKTPLRYDARRSELFFADKLVKHFRHPSPNQQLILITFEQDGWPARLLDPLPLHDGVDPCERLANTVKRLNMHHEHRCVRFGLDGTGVGVLLKLQ